MKRPKALNSHQARAVADALAALNSVGAKIIDSIQFDDGTSISFVGDGGFYINLSGQTVEDYEAQSDFLSAYGL